MRAVCWEGKKSVSVENVPDPEILNPRDAIVRITSTAICGSDLHLYDGFIPSMQKGDILGHEFMGEVVEVGQANTRLKIGDRVIIPFTIVCGGCSYCQNGLWSLCDNSNPNGAMLEKAYGYSGAGLFGYSHLYGGYAGGQAEYARIPYADSTAFKIPGGLPDEKVLFLTDIFPTGYMAAENCGIQSGDTVLVFGCGPVGQFAIRSAFLLGAERVIAVDDVEERLRMAEEGGAETIDENKVDDILEEIHFRTGGNGPDSCIDAVGMEAHGDGLDYAYDRAKQAVRLESDRPTVLRTAIQACRKGGTLSLPGVYGGFVDKMPIGAAFAKGLTFKMGQTHVPRYLPKLYELIEQGKIDPSFVITHPMALDDAPKGYEIFVKKEDGCVKIVLKP